MAQLFVPMLAREATQEESLFWNTKEPSMMEHIGYELLTNMQRFTSQVKFYLNLFVCYFITKKLNFIINHIYNYYYYMYLRILGFQLTQL